MKKETIKILEDCVKIQCSDGNWNYDPCMLGMANGMIFMLSMINGGRPEYLEAPEVWLKDIPSDNKVISENKN